MLLLVAHNGRTLDLDVQGTTRVDALQHALTSLSGVPLQDQIVICAGTRLDPSKTLAAYSLPDSPSQDGQDTGPHKDGEPKPKPTPEVFLYRRSLLRPDSEPPLPEAIPEIAPEEPPEPMGATCPHPLDDPGLSPLVRALPGLERLFKHHLAVAQAFWGASQERYRICQRLLSEQEVQSIAIDAARANVEVHYTYICKAFSFFMEKYTALQQAQREVLLNFERDMGILATTELHPEATGGGRTHLIDLVPKARLQEWANNCREAREQFAVKVADLEAIFAGLRSEVEALFMTSPSVDLDELGRRMEEVHGQLDVEASIMQCFEKDLSSVCKVVEESVRQLAASPSGAVEPGDTCAALERINMTHVDTLLPKIKACDLQMSTFLEECAECKNQMSYDVHQQLKQISSQQSRIRDMRNKLAVFQEVASKQGQLFSELCLVARIPAAYRASLAEVVRRRAFHELYAGQAAQLAERMAALRDKEAGRHESFRLLVEPYMPSDLLGRLGLKLPPPICEVNIPVNPDGSLPEVTVEDIKAVPRESKPSQLVANVFGEWLPDDPQKQKEKDKQPVASPRVELTYEELQLQNARLRADFAAQKAAAHLSHLKTDPLRLLAMSSLTAKAAPGATASSSLPEGSPRQSAASNKQSGKDSVASIDSLQSSKPSEIVEGAGQRAAAGTKEAAFAEALSAKDGLILQLQAKLEAQRLQIDGLSGRVVALEGQAMTLSSGTVPAPVPAAETVPSEAEAAPEEGAAGAVLAATTASLENIESSPGSPPPAQAEAAEPGPGTASPPPESSGPLEALEETERGSQAEADVSNETARPQPDESSEAGAEDGCSEDSKSQASFAAEVAVVSSLELPEPSEKGQSAHDGLVTTTPVDLLPSSAGSSHQDSNATLDATVSATVSAAVSAAVAAAVAAACGDDESPAASSEETEEHVTAASAFEESPEDLPTGDETISEQRETTTRENSVSDTAGEAGLSAHQEDRAEVVGVAVAGVTTDTAPEAGPASPGGDSNASALDQSYGTADGGSDYGSEAASA